MKKIFKLLLIGFMVVLFGCDKEEKKEITISAAASLKEVMNEIILEFEKENKDIKININLGGSGALKNQIISGAPVDIVFFASQKDLKDLDEKGMIEKNYNEDILKNRMVIVGKEKINDLSEIKNHKIAIGTPETVPAGKYAKEILNNSNLWNEVQENIVFSKDVRSAMQYVEIDEVDYAFIYKTDAKIMKNGIISFIVPETLHKPIIYSYGIIKDKNSKEVIKFYEFLKSEYSQSLYEKYNFEIANK
ncbi:molybdate ABC transporter substrate-binding protein [Fusobacterium sp.]|uniref:molybdate ABC transporter substrate-binding protein n=1 Tax=Fusobacterium sp. TaxID=68766 RepID=UPI00260E4D45|nr:molybdate ABC transporter substrate-binding protein [Fusobacterium sp.]